MPFRILARPTSMRRFLVSSFLADVIQHIHSLRASGVMLTHTSVTTASDSIALRKSGGILCTVPDAIGGRVMVPWSLQVTGHSANPVPDCNRSDRRSTRRARFRDRLSDDLRYRRGPGFPCHHRTVSTAPLHSTTNLAPRALRAACGMIHPAWL